MWVGLLAVFGLLGPGALAAEGPPSASALADELANVESRLEQLRGEFASPVAETLTHPLERRLIDAHVFFEQGFYAKAGVLLTDIVENPRFATSRDLPGALYLLGQALYLDHNYQASERAFARLVDPPDPKYHQDALAHLVEIALRTKNPDSIARWFRRMRELPPASRKPDTLFVMGKALFQTDDLDGAMDVLSRVPPDTVRFLQARYYIGAILVARGEHERAGQAFQDVVMGGGVIPGVDPQLVELAHIALGRLLAEQGQSERAVDEYQHVPLESPSYETALYEMAVAYLNAEKLREAKNTLDILILSVTDEQIEVDAQVLRGRLAILLGEHDEAKELYEEVVERFARVRSELRDFLGRRDSVDGFFRWMLRRGDDAFGIGQPLSERVTRWVAAGETMADIQGVLDDLSRARRDLAESRQMAARLRAALAAPNRVDLFTNLRGGWTRAFELENQLVRINRAALDARIAAVDPARCPDVAARLAEVDAGRRTLEGTFRLMPQTVTDYERRQGRVHERYADLQRQAFMVETSLRLLRKQVDAIDGWLRQSAYEDQDAPVDLSRQRRLLDRVREERDQLEAVKVELDGTMAALDLGEHGVGPGDAADQTEAGLKRRLLDAHRETQRLVATCEERQGRGDRRVEEIQERAWRGLETVDRIAARIAESAEKKTGEVRKMVEAESRDLDRFEAALATAEGRALDVAKAYGEDVFRQAEARLADVVLEADLGLVDLSWQRQEDLRQGLREVQEQRAEEIRKLERVKAAVLGDEARPDPTAGDGRVEEGTP